MCSLINCPFQIFLFSKILEFRTKEKHNLNSVLGDLINSMRLFSFPGRSKKQNKTTHPI